MLSSNQPFALYNHRPSPSEPCLNNRLALSFSFLLEREILTDLKISKDSETIKAVGRISCVLMILYIISNQNLSSFSFYKSNLWSYPD